MTTVTDRPEIVFFDLETTVPREGQGHAILEFGSILVCPRKLDELASYSTLVRPTDLSLISNFSGRSNGITRDGVLSAVTFAEIADRVYDILHGRIWAGHNILRFDCARIREAFAEIDRPPPEPKGIIDSYAVLTQKFGRRAGDMKMATLATYFKLGKQTHRSLDDVRMNLEVVKRCATVLFLESTLPNIFTENSWVSPNAITRSRSNGKPSSDGNVKNAAASSSNTKTDNPNKPSSPSNQSLEELHPIFSLVENEVPADAFDMSPLTAEMERETLQVIRSQDDFIDPDEVSIPCISVSLEHFYRRTQIQVTHYDMPLQLFCTRLRVRFGVNRRFVDKAGRPQLNFVVDATPSLCRVLNECDSLAQKLSVDSGSNSEWKSMVTRKAGFSNSPTVKLCIPIVGYGDAARWNTDIYQKENSAAEPHRIVFDRFEFEELESLFTPGTIVDAYFSLDAYDYQQKQIAGIRLVAKKLIVNS